MKIKKERAAVPYSCLIDNIKVLLIFLVVFNHIIAFNLVKVDTVVRYVWYAITIFHMPAFVFISGYLSKKYCVLPEVSCGIYWHCLFTALPLRPWVRSDLLFRSVSCSHYGQEPDRNLPHSCHHQESWYFSRSLLRGISGRVNISQQSVNLRENGSWWQFPESFCGRYRII